MTESIKSGEDAGGEGIDRLSEDKKSILDSERMKILAYNHVMTHEAPTEYLDLARDLKELLKKQGRCLAVRYGSDSLPEELWEAEGSITKEEWASLPKMFGAGQPSFSPEINECAHGAWLDEESKNARVHGGFNLADPKQDTDEAVAQSLWHNLICFDAHNHISNLLQHLGLNIPDRTKVWDITK